MSIANVPPLGDSRCVDDETIFELTRTQIVMHGFVQAPTVGMMIDDILALAERIGQRPRSTASRDHNVSTENIVYMLRGMVLALRDRIATGRARPPLFCYGLPCDDVTLGCHEGCANEFIRRRPEWSCAERADEFETKNRENER